MLKIFIGVVVGAFSLLAYDAKPIKAAEDVYCYIGDYHGVTKENRGFVSNTCLAKVGEKIWLFDSGPTYKFGRYMNEEAKRLFGSGVDGVIVTNYHDDRLLGASYFEENGVPIYVHKKVPSSIKSHPSRFERIKNAISKEDFENTTIPSKFTFIEDDVTKLSKDGNLRVYILSKGTQSPADMLIYLEGRELAFTGNTLFDGRMINFAEDANMEGWLKAIDALKKMEPKVIVQGHGSYMGPDAYKTTEGYLKEQKKQVSALFEQGVGMSEIVGKTDLSKWSYLNHYDDLNGRNIWNYYSDLEWAEF